MADSCPQVAHREPLFANSLMNAPQITNRQLIRLLQTYWQWRWLWIATTVLFGGAGFAYVMTLKKETWVASQGLIVRDEAHGAVMRLGRFQSQTDMKAAQETILELARNPQVVRNALTTVGREEPGPLDFSPKEGPPTTSEIDGLVKDGIEVRAPRGAELGTTEVIYLDVKAPTQERAVALNMALCDELERHMQEVRKIRADGVVAELTTAAESARASLEASTIELRKIEESAGADLSDLRSLTDSTSGGSANRSILDTISAELRTVKSEKRSNEEQLKIAEEAYDDPNKLLTAPAKVLNGNPGLLKLRDGLSAATIATSGLRGRFKEAHPRVVAAIETEERIREQLRTELGNAVTTLRKGIKLTDERIQILEVQRDKLTSRLETLAAIRADYSNIAEEVRSRNEQVQASDRELAGAKASRDAAMTSSLITRLDKPLVGDTPEGPGKTSVLAAACTSGLLFGLGLVFLLSPIEMGGSGFGRRNTDGAGSGRRGSDQMRIADRNLVRGNQRATDVGEQRAFVQRASEGDVGNDHPGERRRRTREADQISAAQASAELPESTADVVARADSTVTSISSHVDVAQRSSRSDDPKQASTGKAGRKSEGSFSQHASAPPRPATNTTAQSEESANHAAGAHNPASTRQNDSNVLLVDSDSSKTTGIPLINMPNQTPPPAGSPQ